MANRQGFLRQAQRFWDVAETVDDAEHTNQAVSNATHAVIAANDAICLYLLGERPGGQSHTGAAQLLQRACQGTEWEGDAAGRARQFAQIVQEKNAAEYEGRTLPLDRSRKVMKQAGRFLSWAERVLPPIALEETEE